MSDSTFPFATIESTLEFFELLDSALAEASSDVARDIEAAKAENAQRSLEALQMVAYKLEKLDFHVGRSKRLLNDLRTLRRLLFQERGTQEAVSVAVAPDHLEIGL
jgi:hypothetical protein